MNTRRKNLQKNFCQMLGLSYDANHAVMYGKFRGYDCTIQNGQNNMFIVKFSAENDEGRSLVETFNQMKKVEKCVVAVELEGRSYCFLTKGYGSENKRLNSLREAMEKITNVFMQYGYKSVCPACGKEEMLDGIIVKGTATQVCMNCNENVVAGVASAESEHVTKSENIIAGAIGATLGSLLGVAVIVILGSIGYVASISGLVMAIFALKGYEKFAGKLSKIGVVITVIVMLLATWFGQQLSYAVVLTTEWGGNIFENFRVVPEAVEYSQLQAEYMGEFGMLVLFAFIGSFSTIRQAVSNNLGSIQYERLTRS